jgi:hypothetical protein
VHLARKCEPVSIETGGAGNDGAVAPHRLGIVSNPQCKVEVVVGSLAHPTIAIAEGDEQTSPGRALIHAQTHAVYSNGL